MGKPIIILAGQSNASRLSDEIAEALDSEYGTGDYILVETFSAGAPLTNIRDSKDDWLTTGELRTDLTHGIIDAFSDNPGSYVEGFIWIQGEADTKASSVVGDYTANLLDLIDEVGDTVAATFENQLTGIKLATFLISTLSDNAPEAENRTNWDDIQDIHSQLAMDESRIALFSPDSAADDGGISADDMFSDGLHYSDEASQPIADALIKAFVDATNSEPSDTVPDDTDGNKCDPSRLTGVVQGDKYKKVSSSNVSHKASETELEEEQEDMFIFSSGDIAVNADAEQTIFLEVSYSPFDTIFQILPSSNLHTTAPNSEQVGSTYDDLSFLNVIQSWANSDDENSLVDLLF